MIRWLPGKRPSDPTRILWLVFWVWVMVGLLFFGLGLNYAWLERQNFSPLLKNFFTGCLYWGDFVFNVLAFLNIYLAAVERLGLSRARKAMILILPLAGILEYVGTKTGYPFGAYHYTEAFGPRIVGVLPMAIPLAWFAVVVGGYLTLSQWLPKLSRIQHCLLTGLFAVTFDWIMEPFAYGVRGYWIWEQGTVPLQNYLTWFVAAVILAWLTNLQAPSRAQADARPPLVLAAMLLTFVVGRIVYGL